MTNNRRKNGTGDLFYCFFVFFSFNDVLTRKIKSSIKRSVFCYFPFRSLVLFIFYLNLDYLVPFSLVCLFWLFSFIFFYWVLTEIEKKQKKKHLLYPSNFSLNFYFSLFSSIQKIMFSLISK